MSLTNFILLLLHHSKLKSTDTNEVRHLFNYSSSHNNSLNNEHRTVHLPTSSYFTYWSLHKTRRVYSTPINFEQLFNRTNWSFSRLFSQNQTVGFHYSGEAFSMLWDNLFPLWNIFFFRLFEISFNTKIFFISLNFHFYWQFHFNRLDLN